MLENLPWIAQTGMNGHEGDFAQDTVDLFKLTSRERGHQQLGA